MRIHHLNCGTMCPFGGRLMDGRSTGAVATLVCHCLLVETPQHGLVLVDTGLGIGDVEHTVPRLSTFYLRVLRPQLRIEQTARRQIEALGFAAADVRHIVLTHLDFDHAGGLEDFPQARVHVLGRELDAARRWRHGFVARRRYRPDQWDEVTRWHGYTAGQGERWFGFACVRELTGLPPELLLVPLRGHTEGHSGVAIGTGDGWLLHAGDAYFHNDEITAPHYRCPPGLRGYQRLMEIDRQARLTNQHRLRRLAADASARVRIISGHDALEFDACAHGRALPVVRR
jgi:glyoxylase-like metal-dependent hydrolase (beta-lactamase superfamily II)